MSELNYEDLVKVISIKVLDKDGDLVGTIKKDIHLGPDEFGFEPNWSHRDFIFNATELREIANKLEEMDASLDSKYKVEA